MMGGRLVSLVKIDKVKDIPLSAPLALLFIGDCLKKAGYTVEVHHFPPEQIPTYAERIAGENNLFIGVSVMSGKPARFAADFSIAFKKRSEAPIVWGGVHPTLLPQQCLQEDYIDYVVVGEGEETSVELAQALEGKRDITAVQGVGFKRDGRFIVNPDRPFIQELDKYKPDWTLVKLEKYLTERLNARRVAALYTSRGCVFNCGFCYLTSVFFDNKKRWRATSVDYVIDQVKYLAENYNIDGVEFWDDLFFVNKQRAFNILEAIDLPWYADIRIDYITDKVAKRLKKTKCADLLLGIESGSNRMLKLMNKGFTTETIVKGTRILAENHIPASYSFILGLPTETWKDIQETIDFMVYLDEIHPKLNFTVGPYLPYPGTTLYPLAIKEGFVPPTKTRDWGYVDRWDGRFDLTWLPWTNKEEIHKISRFAMRLTAPVPPLKHVIRLRLKTRKFGFPVELKLLDWLYGKYYERGFMHELLKIAHKPFRRVFSQATRLGSAPRELMDN